MKKFILLALVLFLLPTGVLADSAEPEKLQEPLSDFELGKYQYCGKDSECIAVQNGCCDCANGGSDVAINKSRMEAFKNRFDCVSVACTMLAPPSPCLGGVVSCVNHKCKYFSEDQFKE